MCGGGGGGGEGGGAVYRGCPNGLCVPLRGWKSQKGEKYSRTGGLLGKAFGKF